MTAQSISTGAGTTMYIVAKTLDNGYHVVAVDEGEPIADHWIARVSELPGCKSDGRTADEAFNNVRELIDEFIGWLREDGLRVPEPNAHLGHDVWDHQTAYTPME